MFLQDLTIALGRRSLKGVRYQFDQIEFTISSEVAEGETYERLNIEARRNSRFLLKMSIWEDAKSWLYIRNQDINGPPQGQMQIHADFAGTTPEDLATLARETLMDWTSVEHAWRKHAVASS
jgi:hypothetical protein